MVLALSSADFEVQAIKVRNIPDRSPFREEAPPPSTDIQKPNRGSESEDFDKMMSAHAQRDAKDEVWKS